MMAKYKAIKYINESDSYKGLTIEDWEAFNRGETVELDKVPEAAKGYIEKEKNKKESK
tara:strand:- start:6788 stop:6961 length:174 start_codon:yes stop_codon:yes gene_type:complete